MLKGIRKRLPALSVPDSLDGIGRQLPWRKSRIRWLGSLRPRTVAGIASAVAAGGAALAIFRRVRNDRLQTGLLSVDGPDIPRDEPTRDELYEMARRRDIAGRSNMTKAELKEALDAG